MDSTAMPIVGDNCAHNTGRSANAGFTESMGENFERMKEGCPVIRRLETDDAYKLPEMVMCVATVSEDMKSIKFVRSDDFDKDYVSVSVVLISEVEKVSASDIDKYAIALMLTGQEIIMELIFATEEDWSAWLEGMEFLCPDLQREAIIPARVTISELIEVIDELQSQNLNLRSILSRYEDRVKNLTSSESRMEFLRIENADLRSVLFIRDETIGEMTVLVESLIKKQSLLSSQLVDRNETEDVLSTVSNASTTIRPHEAMLLKKNSLATPATTGSSNDFDQELEMQMKTLEERKNQLEALIEDSTCALGG